MPMLRALEGLSVSAGLLLGSFLNVCISRLPRHESIAQPRSRCPHCGTAIAWFDNIPVLSFLLLRGRCRACKQRISLRYPAVEIAVGLWFGWVAHDLAPVITAMSGSNDGLVAGGLTIAAIVRASFFIFGFLLIGLAVMDWETKRLPNAFTLPGILLGLMTACAEAIFLTPGQMDVKLTPRHDLRLASPGSFVAKGNVFLTGPEHLVFGRIAAVIGAWLLVWSVCATYKALRGRQGMGLGDAKLLAMIAAFLGFWPAMLAGFLGVISGAVYAATLLLRGRAGAQTRLQFGSFLAAGGLAAAMYADRILPWYRSLW